MALAKKLLTRKAMEHWGLRFKCRFWDAYEEANRSKGVSKCVKKNTSTFFIAPLF